MRCLAVAGNFLLQLAGALVSPLPRDREGHRNTESQGETNPTQ